MLYSSADGGFYSLMVGFGETYLAAFALAVGMGQVAAGLLATVPLLAGGLLQAVTPWGIRWLRSYKRWVVSCASLQAMSYIPLAYAAYRGHLSQGALYLIAAVYWGAAMAAGPVWNNWIGIIIPKSRLADFLAKRTRLTQLAAFIAFLAGGWLLHEAEGTPRLLPTFALLFTAAGLCRVVSTVFLALQSTATHAVPPAEEPTLRRIAARFLDPASSRFLLFLLVSQVSVHIASPFFSPYMLAQLKLGYGEYVWLISASYVSKIAFYPVIARMVRRLGAYRTLWFTGLFVAPMPIFWYATPNIVALCAVQVLAGFMWGAFELASMLLVFDRIHGSERLRILTAFNVLNAASVVTGSLIGGAILAGGTTSETYVMIFTLSAVARGLSLLALTGVKPVKVRAKRLYLRTIALRPGGRAPLEQPILHDDD